MTKTKLVWRLSKLPSVEELRELVKDKIITQDEVRDILFSAEIKSEKDERDIESYQQEIKFLRAVVELLSKNRTHTIEIIKQVGKPYYPIPWYQPYITWCTTTTGGDETNTFNLASGTNSNFSQIQTF